MKRFIGLAIFAIAMLGITGTSRASSIIYITDLSGPNESPPNTSKGIGSAQVDFDIVAHSMRVQVTFSGLSAPTTASHIHAATTEAGTGTAIVATTVPTFPGFPLGVTSGTYDDTFDTSLLSTYNPAFVTANGGTAASAEAALAKSLAEGTAYLNIHTTAFPAGEIRGFLEPVPEPSSLALLGIGMAGLIGYRWRQRKGAA